MSVLGGFGNGFQDVYTLCTPAPSRLRSLKANKALED
jgi:hypothetical protein